MGLISDYFRRRRLHPVIRVLPHVLEARYGAGVFYTVGQVRSAANTIRLDPRLFRSAFAVACTASEFTRADLLFTNKTYQAERTEIARLFHIDERELNCRHLTSRFRNPVSPDGGYDMVRYDLPD
jgi:hypothetical protein